MDHANYAKTGHAYQVLRYYEYLYMQMMRKFGNSLVDDSLLDTIYIILYYIVRLFYLIIVLFSNVRPE